MGRLHFEHHDGDDDGKNSVTESFEAALIHALPAERCLGREAIAYKNKSVGEILLPIGEQRHLDHCYGLSRF
jgi:hypothetical protein